MQMPAGIYPFSTQDGKVIPLDIIKGIAVIAQPYSHAAGAVFSMPANAVVGVLMSDTGCLVRFGEVITVEAGMPISDCIVVPAGGIITTVLTPGDVHVLGLGKAPGTLYVQLIEQWAAIGLPTQYGRK